MPHSPVHYNIHQAAIVVHCTGEEVGTYVCWCTLITGCDCRRINFTVEHLAPVSPAHHHFIQHLTHDHQSDSCHRIRFTANQIPVHSITQCFQYNRNDQMVRREE